MPNTYRERRAWRAAAASDRRMERLAVRLDKEYPEVFEAKLLSELETTMPRHTFTKIVPGTPNDGGRCLLAVTIKYNTGTQVDVTDAAVYPALGTHGPDRYALTPFLRGVVRAFDSGNLPRWWW